MERKTNQKFRKFFAVMVAMVMTITSFAMPVMAAPADYAEENLAVVERGTLNRTPESTSLYMESVTFDDETNLLLSTLNEPPVGVVGFEGPYCIAGYTNETVGITVMFRTPSAVALRLVEEAANPRVRMGRNADQMFVSEALAAHDAFANQLGRLPVPFASEGIEVVGSHYMLFNGVFMNVPASMIESIAALPEVFAVMPSVVYFSMDELANMSEEQWMARERLPVAYEAVYEDAPAEYWRLVLAQVIQGESQLLDIPVDAPAGALVLSNWNNSGSAITLEYPSALAAAGLLTVTVNAFCTEGYEAPVGQHEASMAVVFFDGASLVTEEFTLVISVIEPPEIGPYVPHPEFNEGAKDLFNIPYIHETLGLTGRNVRVGVLDTGVDYRHPVFAPYLIPTHRYTPGLGYYTLPGANFTIIAGRETGRGTSGMEGNLGTTHTNHGTHVAGTIVAMAPDIQLYSFRVLASGVGTQPANSVIRALEYAYYLDLDVVNLSLGNRWNTPWQATAYAIGLLDLAGIISTNSSGNDLAGGTVRAAGRGGWFSTGGGASASPLGITVGAGEAGGRHQRVSVGANINNNLTEINLVGAAGAGWTEEDMVGDYDYVWFGMITLPAGGRTNPAFPGFINEIRELLDGGDLDGKVAIINRGGGEFVTMMDMAHELGAVALIVVNNQADNSHLSGTVLNNDGQHLPAYSLRMLDGAALLGPPTPTPDPPGRGTVNFGVIERAPTPDTLAVFSSAGPLGPIDNNNHAATMQIAVDIIAPGVGILSANNVQHASNVGGRPYVMMGGTSMSAPAVAGIVALMLEQFPHANPLEIRSRIMSTARPLTGYEGQYSILEVGAGFIDPIRALTERNFITVKHAVPFAPDASGWGPPDAGVVSGLEGGWSYQYMSSVSFGRVDMEYGVPARTVTIPVTVRNSTVGSSWDVSYSLLLPTRQHHPPDGNWQLWGPPLDHTVTGVSVEIQQITGHMFAVHLTHDGNIENRGFTGGYLTFTQGDTVITTPFGAYFNIPVPPVPLEPNPNSVIWRPILSNWMTTPHNYGEADPRAFSMVHPGAGWFFPEDVGIITRSNFSSLDFGFIDPNNGPARPLRFYFAPYGYDIADATHFGNAAPLAPGAFTTYVNVVRSIKGGMTDTINQAQGIHVIWEWNEGDATVLAPGVYTLFVRAVHGAGEEYDLVQPFTFVVTDERPTIELENETFYFEEEDEYVTVTGRVSSLGHDLAMEHNVLFRPVAGTIDAPFDYTRVQLQLISDAGTVVVPVNADGTFSFELYAEEADYDLRVIDGVGQVILPIMFGNMILGWSANPASNMLSYFYSFSVELQGPNLCEYCEAYPCECPIVTAFGFDIFNNGEGGSPSRPNASLAAAGLIRMWTQLEGINTNIYLAAQDTIAALDQDGNCARYFVRVGRLWQDGAGWLNYFNLIDVRKDGGAWQHINFSITVNGETVSVLLVNSLYVPSYEEPIELYEETPYDSDLYEEALYDPTVYLTESYVTERSERLYP
ncbi:MAG: S8 family serine peptidase [Firmicutes bacterium]|nr:S8 family serine peptidase [Bacillota bacterium]